MTAEVPDFVTHYHLETKPPFLNLSDLEGVQLDEVINDLSTNNSSARVFGRRYMELRRLTESKMRDLFIAAGGVPERRSPHYFVLGRSEWFRQLSDQTQEIVLPLTALPPLATSITYPDSFTAMAFGPAFDLPHEPKPFHEKVFLLRDLESLISEYGMPADKPEDEYAGYERRVFEKYIEVQLWSDEPVRRYLKSLGS